jgi:hypothetical protein
MIIVDINSAIAYLRSAREFFIEGKLVDSREDIERAIREAKSAIQGIEVFHQRQETE